jgi:hypothetical protein
LHLDDAAAAEAAAAEEYGAQAERVASLTDEEIESLLDHKLKDLL